MCKGVKSKLPMISSHSTGSNTSKWELLKGDMHQGVIEEQASTRSLVEELCLHFFAFCEDIHCQWLGAAVDHLDSFIWGVNIYNGKYRAKYLFLGIISQNGALNICVIITCIVASSHPTPERTASSMNLVSSLLAPPTTMLPCVADNMEDRREKWREETILQ